MLFCFSGIDFYRESSKKKNKTVFPELQPKIQTVPMAKRRTDKVNYRVPSLLKTLIFFLKPLIILHQQNKFFSVYKIHETDIII